MSEQQVMEALRRENPEFQKLEREHRALDEKIKELEARSFITPEDELEIKRLKKEKLAKKDRIAEFIRKYKMEVGSEK